MDANTSFRQRTAAALTHPATLGAVALFLLNDLVLKPAWPDAWLTGKLSDLAFVVFASRCSRSSSCWRFEEARVGRG